MGYFKIYGTLPEDAILIRKLVFMEEQGFVDEFDDVDSIAKHIVFYNDENKAVATCRYFSDEENKTCIVGRIAVVKEFRQNHYGRLVLCEAEQQAETAGMEKIRLAAQIQAVGFYQKQGYAIEGDEFLEEHCPHIWMYKKLKGE